MSKADLLREYFRNNQKLARDSSFFDKAAAASGTHHTYARNLYYYLKAQKGEPEIPQEKTPDILLDESLAFRKYEAKIKDLKTQNEALMRRLEDAELRYDAALNITQFVELTEIKEIKSSQDKHEVVPVISISDIHIEEKVDSDVVNNLNEYSVEIAKERVRKVFANALKLVRMFQKDSEINTVVIALIGDNITGYIHEELMESNPLSPTEATIEVKALLIDGIKLFADSGFKVVVPCCRGNHGRTSAKKKFATGYKNSFEWMMYQDMRNIFKTMQYNNVEFITTKSEFVYVNILGKVNRFCHGDHFKFAGGVGGIFPSMFKFINRINEGIKADCTFMGHWHSYYPAARKGFVVNGSVIGTSPYGLAWGADTPVQNIQLIDSKYGYTGNFPIVI